MSKHKKFENLQIIIIEFNLPLLFQSNASMLPFKSENTMCPGDRIIVSHHLSSLSFLSFFFSGQGTTGLFLALSRDETLPYVFLGRLFFLFTDVCSSVMCSNSYTLAVILILALFSVFSISSSYLSVSCIQSFLEQVESVEPPEGLLSLHFTSVSLLFYFSYCLSQPASFSCPRDHLELFQVDQQNTRYCPCAWAFVLASSSPVKPFPHSFIPHSYATPLSHVSSNASFSQSFFLSIHPAPTALLSPCSYTFHASSRFSLLVSFCPSY